MEAERAAWQEQREKNQARVEALNIVEEFTVIDRGLQFRYDYCGNGCCLLSGEQAKSGNLAKDMRT